jgi:hypothetical protein
MVIISYSFHLKNLVLSSFTGSLSLCTNLLDLLSLGLETQILLSTAPISVASNCTGCPPILVLVFMQSLVYRGMLNLQEAVNGIFSDCKSAFLTCMKNSMRGSEMHVGNDGRSG